MSETFKNLKNELVEEIQALAKDIAESESFIGLVAQQARFQSLNEKFIVLKFLHHKRLGDTVFKAIETAYDLKEQAQPIKENLKDNIQQVKDSSMLNDKVEPTISNSSLAKKVTKNEENEVEDLQQIKEEIRHKTHPKEEAKEDLHLEPIRLDLNDEMGFTQYLFKGDSLGFKSVVQNLNNLKSKSSALNYIDELSAKMNWKSTDEYVERLKEIVTNRFSL